MMHVLTVRYEPGYARANGNWSRGRGAWIVVRSMPTDATTRPVLTGVCGLYLLSPRPYRRGVRVNPRKVLAAYWNWRNTYGHYAFVRSVWSVTAAQRPYTMEVSHA